MWMLVLAMIPLTQATLTIEQIQTEYGFAEIKTDEIEIVNRFDIVLHIIHPSEILDILTDLECNIEKLNITKKIR